MAHRTAVDEAIPCAAAFDGGADLDIEGVNEAKARRQTLNRIILYTVPSYGRYVLLVGKLLLIGLRTVRSYLITYETVLVRT